MLLAGQNPATLAGELAPEILANLHRRNADYSLPETMVAENYAKFYNHEEGLY